jgi:hypothetical protein
MVEIPIDNISRFGLDRVACTLVKKAKLNATTFALENGSGIYAVYREDQWQRRSKHTELES